jgi:cell division protein FtsW
VTTTTGREADLGVSRAGALKEFLDRPLASYYLLLGSSAILLGLGLVMVLSASSVYSYRLYDNSYHVFLKQLTWVVIAAPFALVASRVPHTLLRRVAWPALIVAMVLVALTLTPLGVTVRNNTNWVALGPIQIQPSEIAKLALVLWCADVYARKERFLGDWKHALIPVVPVATVLTGIVILGGDLGTALVLMAIILGMLWVVAAPVQLLVALVGAGGLGVGLLAMTSRERMSRLLNFTDPFADYADSGYQAGHGILAMASGGVFGKGISGSQQKWGSLPDAHTDFIFAVLGEELGLMGTLLVLALFLTIAYAGLRVALRTEDSFIRFMAAGITVWLIVQMMVNIGMVLALLPVIGVPLPLVSYGGSSLVPSLTALGLLISFARSEPGAAAALRSRKRRVPSGVNARTATRRGMR